MTFTELEELPLSRLKEIKEEKQNELALLRQRRFDTIAAILFYQDKIQKEKEKENDKDISL